ncbi:MAG: 6-pyruvoyl-tetrahydropterin synthase [Proteobacteria bacterium]|jgi:6-pyruvoyltetrahydropterin/6-carboxytetrahydropterin synthase|nr:6-pyruvoyl-tetrahydropterin synthase [Pseudomonadota bacterium]
MGERILHTAVAPFEAARQLPKVPQGNQCGRMHGHGFAVILHANQDRVGGDIGVDFDQLGAIWAPVQAELHYACLNDIPGLENPSSEILARWVWERVKPALPALSWVIVHETGTAGCHYDGRHSRIRKEQRFDYGIADGGFSRLRSIHAKRSARPSVARRQDAGPLRFIDCFPDHR